MRSAILTITNDLGLHARAAAQLVQRVSGYHSRVTLRRIDIDRSVDARSILAVLTLAAAKGTIVEIIAEGYYRTVNECKRGKKYFGKQRDTN